MTSLDAQCRSTVGIVADTVLSNKHWQAFGYKRRPRRGRFFNGFVSAEKLERETTLLRELWAAAFGAVFVWASDEPNFPERGKFLAKLTEYCIDGLGEPIWPSFRFATRSDAVGFVVQACNDYTGIYQPAERMRIFLERSGEQMSQPVPKPWVVGVAWLFAHPDSMLPNIARALHQANVAHGTADIELNDQRLLAIFDVVE
jgi:hypothetical protein